MNLTDTAIRNAKPKEKAYKLYDVNGLSMLITPSGSKLWRFKYYYDGKEKSLAMGSYPEISLKRAREKRDEMRTLVAEDIDPVDHRKAQKLSQELERGNTVELIANEWLLHQRQRKEGDGGFADRYVNDLRNRLTKNLFPYLGSQRLAEVTPPDILKMVRKIEERGARETAHRMVQTLGQIFRYAVLTGRAKEDPTRYLKEALRPVLKKHRAALIKPEEVSGLMRAIYDYQGDEIVRCALKLAALFFVRPGELRSAQWCEIDFANQQWTVPAKRMKIKSQDHVVPLCSQALEILQDLHKITGHRQHLFPSPRDWKRPVSDNTINAALRRMGYTREQMTGHGFRAMARTLLDEILKVRVDYIEHQLAHSVRDTNGRAYNRTSFLPERRQMMQAWGDYLDELRLNGVKPMAEVAHIGERVA